MNATNTTTGLCAREPATCAGIDAAIAIGLLLIVLCCCALCCNRDPRAAAEDPLDGRYNPRVARGLV